MFFYDFSGDDCIEEVDSAEEIPNKQDINLETIQTSK